MTTPRESSNRTLVIVLGAFIAIVIVASSLLWTRFDSIEQQQTKDRQSQICRTGIIGELFADSFDALAAPPVDPKLTPAEQAKTPRGIAVARGQKGSDELHHPATACPPGG